MFENDPKPVRLAQFLVLSIPGRPPTLNARRHWRAVAADNKAWKATALDVAEKARHEWEAKHGLRWRPVRHAVISIAFGVRDRRRRDWDNLISTLKPLLDGVVEAGILVDDSTEVIQKIEFGVVITGQSETTIVVEDAEDAA